ncbi:MAG: tetratricopeptide repeat protein [Bacteroidetes bacterium]|nr:tetratricopeptide repeat protein [Bacteroidota bacterium]
MSKREPMADKSREAKHEPTFAVKDFLKTWLLPLSGLLFFGVLFIGTDTHEIEHPWNVGDRYCDSSSRIQDTIERKRILALGGQIIREQLKLHPYHARVWAMYGHYFIQKKDWDSSIYAQKKALALGSGTRINSIEELAKRNLNYALSQKLNPYFSSKDTALRMIEAAEIPGYKNIGLTKFRALVYVNVREFDKAEAMLKEFLLAEPKDFDALYAISLNYFNQGKKAEANEYLNRARQVDPQNPRLQFLLQKLNQ